MLDLYIIAEKVRDLLLGEGLELYFNPLEGNVQKYNLYSDPYEGVTSRRIFDTPYTIDYKENPHVFTISSTVGSSLKFFRKHLVEDYDKQLIDYKTRYVLSQSFFKSVADSIFCLGDVFDSIVLNSRNDGYTVYYDEEKNQLEHKVSFSTYSYLYPSIYYHFLLDENKNLKTITFNDTNIQKINTKLDLNEQKKFLCFILAVATKREIGDHIDVNLSSSFEYNESYYNLVEQLLV